jgi:FHS family L-fucose permease-like MFS transporter
MLIAGVVLVWALLLARTRLPAAATQGDRHDDGGVGSFAAYRALLGRPRYLAGVAAQFFYVGAQVGIWSYLIRYVGVALPELSQKQAAWLLTGALILFMAGRFVGSALLARISGARLMLAFALIDGVLCIVAASLGGWIGVSALLLSSFFMSVMYPTIFVLSLRGLGPLTKPGASLIVMAIIGGAVLTAAMGLVSDQTGTIRAAMLVPALCFGVIALFARLHVGDEEPDARA